MNTVNRTPNPQEALNQLIHQPDVLELIFRNSADAREKLKKYILKEMHIEPGDTLVLIDTGYVGVTQDFLARALGNELDVEITGRYFIGSHEPDRPNSQSLITSSWCEHGIFEQCCTYKEGSALGYTDDGDPIFDAVKLSGQQYEKVQAIQTECVRFIKDAQTFFSTTNITLSYNMLQKTAEAALFRQIFFPTVEEVVYFQHFQHDKDMGPDLKKTMYHLQNAVTMTQQSHLPYRAHPYEARAISLEHSLASLMKRSLDLDFTPEEQSYYHETLKIVAISGANNAQTTLNAVQTFDGFHSCYINVVSNFHVGIVFGEHYQWVQIERISLLSNPTINLLDNEKTIVLNKMKRNKTLFECEGQDALLMLSALNNDNTVITYQIVFRPIIRWNGSLK